MGIVKVEAILNENSLAHRELLLMQKRQQVTVKPTSYLLATLLINNCSSLNLFPIHGSNPVIHRSDQIILTSPPDAARRAQNCVGTMKKICHIKGGSKESAVPQ